MNLLISNSINLIQTAVQSAIGHCSQSTEAAQRGELAQAGAGGLAPTINTTHCDGERGPNNDEQGDDDDDEDDDDEEDNQSSGGDERAEKGPAGEQMTRLRMKRFSSSALCLNDNDRAQGKAGSVSSEARRRQAKRTDDRGRYFDAVDAQGAAADKKDRAKPTITVSSLAATADDPVVVYARQRRPSVSNQGSLNVDQQALFSAVECNQLERVKSILDDGKVNVNSLNGDKLTCLDIAVLLRNPAMVRLLQQYKAKESSAYLTSEGRENQLYSLYMEARRLVEDLSRSIGAMAAPNSLQVSHDSASGDQQQQQQQPPPAEQPQQLMLATGSLLTSALFEEKQRQLQYWRRRLDLFMQMRYGFEKLDVPSIPELVVLQVVGESSLGLKIVHSLGQINELFSSLGQQQLREAQQQRLQFDSSQPVAIANFRRAPMSRLINQARERRVHCPLGPKCSHWLIDELVAYRQNSDQFQNHDPNDLLVATFHDADFGALEARKQREPVRFRLDQASPRRSSSKSKLQQERLAIFNQLLAQQLTILSNQQRQQQQLELLHSSRHKLNAAAQQQQQQQQQPESGARAKLPNHLQHQLIYAHQIESTDSAYASIAAAAASSDQHQQVSLLSIQPTSLLHFGAAAGQQQHQQPPVYRSLAYQLMTARRYNDTLGEHAKRNNSDKTTGVGPSKLSTGSVRLASLARQTDSPELALAGDQLTGPALRSACAPIITKYRVEWSTSAHFDSVRGSMIIYNTNAYPLECQIGSLENGQPYFVRVSSGNHKGFSPARLATPACLAPSSWRQALPTVARNANAGASSMAKKKFKYDEEVFRKFTKLILLNKHILDESQLNWLQREQQQLQNEGGACSSKWVANKMANLQNKSSLINMLLLDATMPLARPAERLSPAESPRRDSKKLGANLNYDAVGHHFRLTASSSPRGSLYPVGTGSSSAGATSATEDNDSLSNQSLDFQQQQTSLKVKKNLRHLFQSNSTKFNKLNNQNKRGLYLATVIYHTPNNPNGSSGGQAKTPKQRPDSAANAGPNTTASSNTKLVVTNDDRLPVIEIFNDLVAPSSLMADFYWLLKINGTSWIDMKRLRQQLQRSHSSSTLHLRIKLLAAIEQMQVALNLEDIGRLFYKPIQAHDGSIVICTCRSVASTKAVSSLSTKWTYQHKLIPRHLKKVSDLIASSNKERERQQEQQMRQQQLARNSMISLSGGQQQTILVQPMNKRASSGALGSHTNTRGMATGGGGAVTEEAQTHTPGSPCTTPTSSNHDCSMVSSSSSALATAVNSNAGSGLKPDQQANARLLMPAEAGRLCETCQQALVQRRCTMASGSSSSSLASNESQSWSSSQFSLNSQQQIGAARSCTCSRSNSSVATSGPLTAGTPLHQPQQNRFATCNQLQTTNNLLGSSQMVASAPSSQRNSTQSNRSASGSVGMMMMMIGQSHPTTGSFSSAVPVGGSLSGPSTAGPSRPSQASTQPADPQAGPQSSSTYLMLASLSPYDLLLFHLREVIEFDQTSTTPLKRGLYLGFVQLQTTVESMRLLVPRKRPNMLPCARIRDNAHVSREEWALLKRFSALPSGCCPPTAARPTAPLPHKINAQNELQSSLASRLNETSVWIAQTARESCDSGPNQDGALQDKRQVPAQTSAGDCAGLTAARGFERDRAKSVSPGFVDGAASSLCQREPIRQAQKLACSVAKQCAKQEILLKPSAIYSSSCSIGERQSNEEAQSHAHSDTNLALSSSSIGQVPEVDCDIAGEAQSSSDSNLTSDKAGLCGERPQLAATKPQRSGSSGSISNIVQQSPEMTFMRLIGDAARRLLLDLKSQLPKLFDDSKQELVSVLASLNDEENNRVYHIELIELSNQVTFILLIPTPENVCPVTSNERSNILAHNADYMLLPLQIFETIHLGTYEPDLLGKYSRLSTILETDLIVAQHDHRQAFSSTELKSTKSRVSHLQDMVSIADEFWRQLRWIVDVVSFARDKSQLVAAEQQAATGGAGSIRLGAIWLFFEHLASNCAHCCSSGASLASATGGPVRKSNARAVLGGSQQNLSGAGSPSFPLGEQHHSKLALMKTNSSGENRSRGVTAGAVEAGLSGLDSHDQVKRASSAQLHRAQRDSDRQRAAREAKIATAIERAPLPEIQLSSGDHSAEEDAVAAGNNPNSDKSREEKRRAGRRRHSQADGGSEDKLAKSARANQQLDEPGPRARPRNDGANDARAEGQQDEGRDNANNSREEICLEESILKVQFGEHDQEMILVGQERGSHIEAGLSNDPAAHTINAPDDDDEAIYAYHISLRDATKAAAKRKSSQQLINLFIDHADAPLVGGSSAASTNVGAGGLVASQLGNSQACAEELRSTCGGLNLDRKQFERFALATMRPKLDGDNNNGTWPDADMMPHPPSNSEAEPFARNNCCPGLGDVTAYKFKKVSLSASSASKIAEHDGQSKFDNKTTQDEQLLEDDKGAATVKVGENARLGQFKSTNPFLTDSFEL